VGLEGSALPLQWLLHPGDQGEAHQVLHQSLSLLQAADWSVAAGHLQELPARRHNRDQLVRRLRLRDLKSSRSVSKSQPSDWMTPPRDVIEALTRVTRRVAGVSGVM